VSIGSTVSDNVCYRHQDRQSFVLCQRCGRTVCPDCQTQAAVGVHCPECVREGRQAAPRTRPAVVRAFRRGGSTAVVTYSILGLCIGIYLLQIIPGSGVTSALLYFPPLTYTEPWRMITALFVHSQNSIFHILFNMYALFLFGPLLEGLLGRSRFLALYLLSGFGGSVAVLLLAPMSAVVGASGAIFGLFGAFFVIQRKLGGNSVQLFVVIGLNFAIGFLPGTNISWQAHLGGVIVGALVGLIYLATRRPEQKVRQIALISSLAIGLVMLTLLRLFVI